MWVLLKLNDKSNDENEKKDKILYFLDNIKDRDKENLHEAIKVHINFIIFMNIFHLMVLVHHHIIV